MAGSKQPQSTRNTIPPLWRSKRFLASVATAVAVAAGIFILVESIIHTEFFGSELVLPLFISVVALVLIIVFLPRFIYKLHTGVTSFLADLTKGVIDDFLKERAERVEHAKQKKREEVKRKLHTERKIVLDTSSIIDGRFLKVVELGFLRAAFIVPQCVLDELQAIADSKNDLRRMRGRRGLDVLKKLKKIKGVKVETPDYRGKYDDLEVDKRLVKICKEVKADLLTVDFNLNRVSGISGVGVLNVNALVNSIKAPVIPGDLLEIKLVQEGKEKGQAVGYLEDGTMVVVENGHALLNKKVTVNVTRIFQTSAGQMIFASPQE